MNPMQSPNTGVGARRKDVESKVVMWRDASFWNAPGRASKLHLPRVGETGPYGHHVAVCNKRIQLDGEPASTVDEAGALMCKKCLNALSGLEGEGNGPLAD